MHWERDGMMLVRADLCDRIETLQRAAEAMSVRDFVQKLGTLRTLARAYNLVPVVALADALERAVRNEPRHCPAGIYFDRLRDAIGCAPADEAASQAMLASISVRLGA